MLFRSDTRGLIAQRQVTASAVKKVQFTADPTPIMSAAINYYSPKGAGKPATNWSVSCLFISKDCVDHKGAEP